MILSRGRLMLSRSGIALLAVAEPQEILLEATEKRPLRSMTHAGDTPVSSFLWTGSAY